MKESPGKKQHRSNQRNITFGLDRLAFGLLAQAEKEATVTIEKLEILEGVGKYLAVRTRLPETEVEDDFGLADYRRAIEGPVAGPASPPAAPARAGSVAAKSAAIRGIHGPDGPSLTDFKARAAVFARNGGGIVGAGNAVGSKAAAASGPASGRIPDVPNPAKPVTTKPPDDEQF